MKALIHIGPQKTGTTSIQAFLRQNRNTFLENHIGTFAHGKWVRMISASFQKNPPKTPWAKSKGILHPQKFASFKARTLENLRSEIQALQGKSDIVVFSSEGLFTLDYEEIFDLKAFFDRHFEYTEIICYLRRQDFLYLSKQKNLVRNEKSTQPVLTKHFKNTDYWLNLSKWLQIFGKRAICVRIFPDSSYEPNDLIEDFKSEISKRIGPLSGNFVIPENRNTSWDWKAIEFVRIANEVSAEKFHDTNFHDDFVRLIDTLYKGGEKPTLSREGAISIVSNYAESNKLVRDELRPDLKSLFHEDFSCYPDGELSQQLTTEDAVKIAIEMIFLIYSSHNKTSGHQNKKKYHKQKSSGLMNRIKKATWLSTKMK